MPSPFPGTNPWLEQDDVWHDFHVRFMPAAAESLTSQVRPEYFVKLEGHIYIRELPGEQRLAQAVDVESLPYIEIRDARNRQLITVVELLSPSNKRPGPDRNQYLAKRRQLLASHVHFVELDHLREYPRLPVEGLPECDYYALVSQAETRPRVALWPLGLRDRLPRVPIPLRSAEERAWLDLQEVLHRVYDAAGYQFHIYSGQPEPPLKPDESVWAETFLPVRG